MKREGKKKKMQQTCVANSEKLPTAPLFFLLLKSDHKNYTNKKEKSDLRVDFPLRAQTNAERDRKKDLEASNPIHLSQRNSSSLPSLPAVIAFIHKTSYTTRFFFLINFFRFKIVFRSNGRGQSIQLYPLNMAGPIMETKLNSGSEAGDHSSLASFI